MSDGFSNIVDAPSTGEAKDNDDIVVDGTAGGVVLLAANPGRKSALIINVGAEPMRVTTDGTAPTATHGKRVVSGGSLSMSSPYCPTKEVKAIREGAVDTTANASEVD
jgi:hypothetical protein